MKSNTLQDLVKAVFKDEDTKRQFISNPESVLAKYDLTEEDRKAVLSTHAGIGLVTSDSPQLEVALKSAFEWASPMQ